MKYFYDTEFLEGPQTKRFLGVPIGKTKPTIDLISIGIVSEDNREYYAVSKDFNLDEAWNRYDIQIQTFSGDLRNQYPNGRKQKHYWIRENVLMPIFFELAMIDFHNIHFKDEWFYEGKKVTIEVFKAHKNWSKNKKWFRKLLDKYGKTNEQIKIETSRFIINNSKCLEEKTNAELYGYYSAYDHVVFCWLFGKMIDLPSGFPMYTRDLKQILDELATDFSNKICYESGNHTVWSLKETIEYFKKKPNYPKQTNEHNALADAKWNKELFNFINYISNETNRG